MKDADFLYQHPLYYISGNESKTLEEIKKPANEIAENGFRKINKKD